MVDVKKLVGFKRFKAKNGKEYCVANVLSDYTDADKNCVGQKVEELFLPDDFVNYLNSKMIGHDLEVSYQINNNRAFLTGVKSL